MATFHSTCRRSRTDPIELDAGESPVEQLPNETLVFLLGSRYCETDKLADIAWRLFGSSPRGWRQVQAICDFVCGHLTFGYEHARATRAAFEAYQERIGVCRDFAHLAVTFCRCVNIPVTLNNIANSTSPRMSGIEPVVVAQYLAECGVYRPANGSQGRRLLCHMKEFAVVFVVALRPQI